MPIAGEYESLLDVVWKVEYDSARLDKDLRRTPGPQEVVVERCYMTTGWLAARYAPVPQVGIQMTASAEPH